MNDVTVILRECGERTSACVYEDLSKWVKGEALFRVSEVPFSASVKKSFEIGIAEGRKWTLCLDADVFPSSEALGQLLTEFESFGESTFEIQGLVYDKFLGIARPAGNHLYRTSLLGEGVQLIPQEGESVRPESDMLKAMQEKGFCWKQSRLVVGLHDFEQSYVDIYRKCFLQAHKHREFLSFPTLMWERLENDDPDFQIALRAVGDGLLHSGEVLVDKRFAVELSNRAIGEIKPAEKKPLEGCPRVEETWLEFRKSLPVSVACLREQFQEEMSSRFFPKNVPGRGEPGLEGKLRRLDKRVSRLEKVEQTRGRKRWFRFGK